MANLNSFPGMTQEQMSEINTMISDITNKVKNFVDLDVLKIDLKGKQNMGGGSTNFVRVSVSHAIRHPEYTVMEYDVVSAERILGNYEKVLDLCRQLQQLGLILENNSRLMGSDLMNFANSYYMVVKRQAAKGDPNAVIILNDLSERYKNSRKKQAEKPPSPPAS